MLDINLLIQTSFFSPFLAFFCKFLINSGSFIKYTSIQSSYKKFLFFPKIPTFVTIVFVQFCAIKVKSSKIMGKNTILAFIFLLLFHIDFEFYFPKSVLLRLCFKNNSSFACSFSTIKTIEVFWRMKIKLANRISMEIQFCSRQVQRKAFF